MALEYNTDLFDASTIDRIAGTSGAAWTASPPDPARTVASSAADRRERRRVLTEWQGPVIDVRR